MIEDNRIKKLYDEKTLRLTEIENSMYLMEDCRVQIKANYEAIKLIDRELERLRTVWIEEDPNNRYIGQDIGTLGLFQDNTEESICLTKKEIMKEKNIIYFARHRIKDLERDLQIEQENLKLIDDAKEFVADIEYVNICEIKQIKGKYYYWIYKANKKNHTKSKILEKASKEYDKSSYKEYMASILDDLKVYEVVAVYCYRGARYAGTKIMKVCPNIFTDVEDEDYFINAMHALQKKINEDMWNRMHQPTNETFEEMTEKLRRVETKIDKVKEIVDTWLEYGDTTLDDSLDESTIMGFRPYVQSLLLAIIKYLIGNDSEELPEWYSLYDNVYTKQDENDDYAKMCAEFGPYQAELMWEIKIDNAHQFFRERGLVNNNRLLH